MLFLFVLAAYWHIQTSLHEAESALSAQNVALHTLIASHLLSFIKHCSQNLLFNNSSNELHATVNIQKLVTRLASQKKKIPAFYGTQFSIPCLQVDAFVSTPARPIALIYILILSSYLLLCLSSSLIISGFSTKKTEFLIFFSSVVCSVHLLMSECLYKRGV